MNNRNAGLFRSIEASIIGNAINEGQLERKMREAAISSGIQRAEARNVSLFIGSLERVHQLSKMTNTNHKVNTQLDVERLPKYYKKPERKY